MVVTDDGEGERSTPAPAPALRKKERGRSHSEAERKRRQRINAHLATLRTLVPSASRVRACVRYTRETNTIEAAWALSNDDAWLS
jgi:hypothetical protein